MSKATETLYRFQATVPRVHHYLMDPYVTELASYKNQVSGWIREGKIRDLKKHFPEGTPIRLIEFDEYWENYELYNQ